MLKDIPINVFKKVEAAFGKVLMVDALPDPRTWSSTWHLQFDSKCIYLKKTPRIRHENIVTQHLSQLSDIHVPAVLLNDIDLAATDVWFAIEDKGKNILIDGAVTNSQLQEIVGAFGDLQKRSLDTPELAALLPSLIPERVGAALQREFDWSLSGQWSGNQRHELQEIFRSISHNIKNLERVLEVLKDMPQTILHGDFEAGNIIYNQSGIYFIDWADAQWGPASTSLLSLASRESNAWDNSVWQSYSDSLGYKMTSVSIKATETVSTISAILVDAEIARSIGSDPSTLLGVIPNFRYLLNQISQ